MVRDCCCLTVRLLLFWYCLGSLELDYNFSSKNRTLMEYNLFSCMPGDSWRIKRATRNMESHVDSHHCDVERLWGLPGQKLDPRYADVRGCGTLRKCVLVKAVRSLGTLPLKGLICVSLSITRKGCHKRTFWLLPSPSFFLMFFPMCSHYDFTVMTWGSQRLSYQRADWWAHLTMDWPSIPLWTCFFLSSIHSWVFCHHNRE